MIEHRLLYSQQLALGRRFIIYGSGSLAEKYLNQNSWLYMHLECFLVTHAGQADFMGKKVFGLAEFDKKWSDFFIIIASSFYVEIMAQLEKLGLKEGEHFVQIYKPIDSTTKSKRLVSGVEVGKYSYGYEAHCYRGSLLKSIGAFCSINHSVRIGEFNHPLDMITTHPILYISKSDVLGYEGVPGLLEEDELLDLYSFKSNGQVVIGNDVWIGANAVILPGVTLGNGSVIAAGAIVTRSVPDYAVVAGVPAKVIRYRFSHEQIEILNRVKWWDWDDEFIRDNIHLIKEPNRFFSELGSVMD
jgi:acetyltransferase-like isoleucine patch superfamily enzyme